MFVKVWVLKHFGFCRRHCDRNAERGRQLVGGTLRKPDWDISCHSRGRIRLGRFFARCSEYYYTHAFPAPPPSAPVGHQAPPPGGPIAVVRAHMTWPRRLTMNWASGLVTSWGCWEVIDADFCLGECNGMKGQFPVWCVDVIEGNSTPSSPNRRRDSPSSTSGGKRAALVVVVVVVVMATTQVTVNILQPLLLGNQIHHRHYQV